MPRAVAALTMEPVLGPRRTSSSSSRRRLRASGRSKGVSSSAARTSCWASSIARRPTSSSLYSTTTWNTPGSIVVEVRPNVTGQPAGLHGQRDDLQHVGDGDGALVAPGRSRPVCGRRRAAAPRSRGGCRWSTRRRRRTRWPRSPCSCSTDWGRAALGCGKLPWQVFLSVWLRRAPIRARRGGVSVAGSSGGPDRWWGRRRLRPTAAGTKSPVAMASSAPAMALPWSGSSSMCLTRLPCARPWRSSARAWPSGRLLRTVASSYSTTRSKASPSSLPCSIRSASRRSAPAE